MPGRASIRSPRPWNSASRRLGANRPAMPGHQRHTQLSKFLSLMLRHQPERFGLRLDADGFVPLTDLLAAVRRERAWQEITEEYVREVVATSDKQRFEIDGDRIRARYGHSVAERITHP